MPISTPDVWVSKYADQDHFKHVLNHLFIPALKEAGFTPIPPIAKGAELIQAGIIKNIEKADLVLCDMSTLNPNVFFEFGIRTAVNKPVCIVKDEKTEKVPFDTTILNYHDYSSELRPWNQKEQVERLVLHIQESMNGSDGQNALWKYFGLSTRAVLTEGAVSKDDKLDLLTLKVDGLSRLIEQQRKPLEKIVDDARRINIFPQIVIQELEQVATQHGLAVLNAEFIPPDRIELMTASWPIRTEAGDHLKQCAARQGYELKFIEIKPASAKPKKSRKSPAD
jgi:hypothetical protein